MPLRHGLLGLLTYKDMTGYDLDKMVQESLGLFWHCKTSQVYRELSAMNKKGWIGSRTEIQKDRPNKKIYSLTESGKKELSNWLCENRGAAEDSIQTKIPLSMRLFFGNNAPKEVSVSLLKSFRQELKQKIKDLSLIPPRAKEKPAQKNSKELYWSLVIDYGKAYYSFLLKWTEASLKKLG